MIAQYTSFKGGLEAFIKKDAKDSRRKMQFEIKGRSLIDPAERQ
jgi:hypothetical protein